jgi:hypothetical protein
MNEVYPVQMEPVWLMGVVATPIEQIAAIISRA